MNDKNYGNDLKVMRRMLVVSQLIIAGVVIALVLSLWANINAFGRDRTIVIPPHLEKSFWVNNTEAASPYVEQMANWIAFLELDVTPDNVDWKNHTLLEYAHPDFHGELQTRQQLQAEKVKKENLVTEFAVKTTSVNAQQLAAIMFGNLITRVNGHEVGRQDKYYFVQFSLVGGRSQLMTFEEAPYDDVNHWIEERKHVAAPNK